MSDERVERIGVTRRLQGTMWRCDHRTTAFRLGISGWCVAALRNRGEPRRRYRAPERSAMKPSRRSARVVPRLAPRVTRRARARLAAGSGGDINSPGQAEGVSLGCLKCVPVVRSTKMASGMSSTPISSMISNAGLAVDDRRHRLTTSITFTDDERRLAPPLTLYDDPPTVHP